MARVDRLGSAREVLQIGAAIGREFPYEVLAAVAGMPDVVLQDALIRLTEAELLFLRGTPPNAVYSFKHALVQDTAYSTMLRARRQQLHAAIALVLEKRFPDVVNTTPEVIAQQFERAGQNARAVDYYMRAGDRDLHRFAMKEAVTHYSSALRLVEAMPELAERDGIELGVRLGFGLAQLIAIGPSAPEAAAHYRRALALSRALPGRGRERFLASWGLWFNAGTGGRAAEAAELSDELLSIARELDNRDFLLEAYHAKVPTLLRNADFVGVNEAAQEVERLYDRERHRDHAYYFGGHDARMCARAFHSIGLWAVGFPDQAHRMALLSIEDARDLGHAFTLAHALQRGALTMVLLNDVESCRVISDELYPLAERNNFPWQLMDAKFLRGWLVAQSGDLERGIKEMLQAVDHQIFTGFRPMLMPQIVEAQLCARLVDAAKATLEHAFEDARTQGNLYCLPELHRLRGDILLMQSRADNVEAERSYREAMAMAAGQSCRPLELRAATSLARLLAEHGRREEARGLLAPVYGAFTEGFERPDLQAAKAMLAALV